MRSIEPENIEQRHNVYGDFNYFQNVQRQTKFVYVKRNNINLEFSNLLVWWYQNEFWIDQRVVRCNEKIYSNIIIV